MDTTVNTQADIKIADVNGQLMLKANLTCVAVDNNPHHWSCTLKGMLSVPFVRT